MLRKLNKGERFEDLALMHSADPTNSSKGGDLGWFPQGRMVAPFEKAVFGATSVGVVPSIVETDFGYHIIKVTGVKTKDKFQIASIAKEITSGDETRESAYRAAGVFAGVRNGQEFVKLSEEMKALRLQALTIPRDADYINDIKHAKVRDVVRWAYSDEVEPGSVSEIFEVGDKYLVAMLRSKSDKGRASLDDVREKVKAAVIRELKADQILAKMNAKKGASLEDLATDNGVTILTTEDVAMTSSQLTGVGFAPAAIGKAFGMKAGQKTAPFKDENGVMVMEVTALNAAQSVADYNTYKQQLTQRRNGQVSADAIKAIKKLTKTEDYISKYY